MKDNLSNLVITGSEEQTGSLLGQVGGLKFTLSSVTLVSSRIGVLGTANVGSSMADLLTKPTSADSTEYIYTWFKVIVSSATGSTGSVSANLFGATLSGLTASSVYLYTGYPEGSEVAAISVPANSSVEVWLYTSSYPSSQFYHLPTGIEVSMATSVLYNHQTADSGNLRTVWKAYSL